MTPVFEGTHWDSEKRAAGKQARRIYIRFDKILDADERMLEVSELKQLSDTMRWAAQSSGISIPDEVASKLELIWQKY